MTIALSVGPSLAAEQGDKFAGMVRVPGGPFTMGRNNGPPEERPAHEVILSPFYIDKNLVTIGEYAKFIQAKGPVGPKGEMYLDVADPDNRIFGTGDVWRPEPGSERYPASEMSWHGAVAYCKWLGKRLPSEAEWEKAARGTDKRLYPWGNAAASPDLAFFGGYRGETVPVGQFSKGASPYGALDMAGQVWEWTRSIAARYPYDPKDGREDLSAEQPRVTRGGSSSSDAEGLTATSRHIVDSGRQATGHAYHGFRCVSKLEMVL
jgi:formylglycine-generating enzyme required for sulfatase activity